MVYIKLINCLNIAKECELETVGEALYNINIHALSLFDYEKTTEELNEMYESYKISGLTENTLIKDALKLL